MKYFIIALLLVGFVSGTEEHLGEQSVDQKISLCDLGWISDVCDIITKTKDTTNKIVEDMINSAEEDSDTVKDIELVLLEEEKKVTTDRVRLGWNNILSVIYLFMEVVKIFFFSLQLFVLVHLPYFYVKLLVWIKKVSMGMATSRKGRA